MKHVFIINPSAGKKDSRQKVYDMADALRERHGVEVECMLTTSRGHATQLARSIAALGEPVRFYACGGDGTVNEVANGIVGFDNAAMTAIPIGTGNDFLKNFGQEKLPLFSDAENLWDGEVKKIDLIECNGRQCLCIACSGLDARIADDVHKFGTNNKLDGKSAYVLSLAANFLLKDIGRHWTVTLGDTVLEDDFALVAVCNGRFYGGGFMPVAEASLTDGVLDTLVVKNVSKANFLRFVGPYSKGEYRKFPKYAQSYTVPEIRIHSDGEEITTCVDGETIRAHDIVIRLSGHKLNFFGPTGFDPDATRRV